MNLRESAFSAIRWTTAGTASRFLLQVLQTMILARILSPADFGAMTIVTAIAAVAISFTDFGLSAALMHFQVPGRKTLNRMFIVNLTFAAIFAAILALLAPTVSGFYAQQVPTAALACIGLVLPLAAIGQQPRALAEKRLEFHTVAKLEITAVVVGFTIAVISGSMGFGVYALIGGVLSNAASFSALAWIFLRRPTVPAHDNDEGPPLGDYLAFGIHRIGEQFWGSLRQQADVFIASLFGSTHQVALYATPRDQSLKIANSLINPIVTRVGLPIMAKLKEDKSALQFAYLRTIRLIASLNFPAYAVLAIFPADVIALLLGGKWQGAAEFLRIFALWGMIRSVGNPSGSLLYARGMAKRAHAWNFGTLLVLGPALWLAGQTNGLIGIAWTLTITQGIFFVFAWRLLLNPACGVSFATYIGQLMPPLAATALATAAALVVAGLTSEPLRFPSGLLAFASVYLFASLIWNEPLFHALRELGTPIVIRLRRNA